MNYQTRDMRALREFYFDGQNLRVGDRFVATEVDAGYLTRHGKAEPDDSASVRAAEEAASKAAQELAAKAAADADAMMAARVAARMAAEEAARVAAEEAAAKLAADEKAAAHAAAEHAKPDTLAESNDKPVTQPAAGARRGNNGRTTR